MLINREITHGTIILVKCREFLILINVLKMIAVMKMMAIENRKLLIFTPK